MTDKPARTIVIGVDGSNASVGALRWAMLKGQELDATVQVVHCWYPHSLPELLLGSVHEMRTGSECMLANEVTAARADTGVSTQVITSSVQGRPAPVLLAHAESALMLVLGTHGKFGLRELVLGQTAAQCRRKANCPVVIVDADGRRVLDEALTDR
ncbi:universal stress protein [Nakamurella lactea]|uniref:universal stress protein n=1 Tax=Nakamurella lactea TaxID=459515 RepID=UPI00040CD17B|nr:universal stress protein [Nakamurella lactea]